MRNLKRIIADRDMTAAQLSRATGVPKTTLAEWLAGGNPRDLKKVKLVADALAVSVDQLCFGDVTKAQGEIEQHLEEINAGVFEVVLRRVKK